MSIKHWPTQERPRERLLQSGPATLSDAELLAIFLRTGVAGQSALDLARTMLNHFGSLQGLFSATLERFSEIKGLGPAKYVQLQAVLELSRRTLLEELPQQDILESPQAVQRYLQLILRSQTIEVFMAIFLDPQNRVIVVDELSRGTLLQTSVYPREVVKRALHHHAASVIFAHNHPSGAAEPSQADLWLTTILKQALSLVDVVVVDHLIVAQNQVLSLAERGLV